MVNKAVIGVIGVILIATLGVGALVGLQGGGEPPDSNTNGTDGTPSGTTPTAAPTGTEHRTVTTPTGERTPIHPSEFNRGAIESEVTAELNEWRTSTGLSRLETGGTTAQRLSAMARDLSAKMADEGNVSHVIDGVDTSTRYRNHDMFDACQYQTSEGFIAQPGAEGGRNVQFEYVTSTIAGGSYETDNGTRFNEDDAAVAQAIVENIKAQEGNPPGILKENIAKIGVGVEITRTGGVYATVHLCGE